MGTAQVSARLIRGRARGSKPTDRRLAGCAERESKPSCRPGGRTRLPGSCVHRAQPVSSGPPQETVHYFVVAKAALVCGGKVVQPAQAPRKSRGSTVTILSRVIEPLHATLVSEQRELPGHAAVAGGVVALAAKDRPAPAHTIGMDYCGSRP